MANEQDIVDAIRSLQNDNAQMLRALQQMSTAIQQLARSGGARAGGVNAGPRNPNSLKDRLIARTKNQAERSLAIKAGRALIAPAEGIFSAAGQAVRSAVAGAGSGAGLLDRLNRGAYSTVAGSVLDLGGYLQKSESVLGRATSSVSSFNEEIARQGGQISDQSLQFQTRFALQRERRAEAARTRVSAIATSLSEEERKFQGDRVISGIFGTEPPKFSQGLELKEVQKELEETAKGLRKFRDALDPRSARH